MSAVATRSDDRVLVQETDDTSFWSYRDTKGTGVADEKMLVWQGGKPTNSVEPTGRSSTCTTKGISASDESARSNQRSKPSEYMFVNRWICGSRSAASRSPSR